jgi:hypothetical protein
MRRIELHESEYEAVLLALGYATGWAMKDNRSLAHTFLWAANALNRGNPNWTMYELPADLKPDEVIRKFVESIKGAS